MSADSTIDLPPSQTDKLSSLPEITAALAALGDYREYRVMLFRTYPEKLSDGTKCSGRLKAHIEDPHYLEDDSVQEEFGGGDFYIGVYRVGEKGIKKRYAFGLPGKPKLPPHMLESRRLEASQAPGNGNGHSATDATLGGKALDQATKMAEAERREREEYARRAIDAEGRAAKALAEVEVLKQRMAELEARPAVVREERAAERTAASEAQAAAVALLKSAAEMSLEAERRRAETAERALVEARSSTTNTAEQAAAPYKQYLEMIDARHRLDMEAAEKRFEQMMKLDQQRADNALKMQKEENERLRIELKNNKNEGGLEGFSKMFDLVSKVSNKIKGDEAPETPIDKLLSALADPAVLERLPAAAAAARHFATGQPMPALPPPTPVAEGAPPGAGAPAQPQAPQITPAQAQMIADTIATLKDAFTRNITPPDTADFVISTIGKDAGKLIVSQPVDVLIAGLSQREPAFASPKGDEFLRKVYVAVQKRMG